MERVEDKVAVWVTQKILLPTLCTAFVSVVQCCICIRMPGHHRRSKGRMGGIADRAT